MRLLKSRDISPLEPSCRKRIYQTKEDADDMARHISETRTARVIRTYKCDVCGFWHLTSSKKP